MYVYRDVGGRVTHGAVTEEVGQSFRILLTLIAYIPVGNAGAIADVRFH
jgi:hypothetical protein